MRSNFIPSVLLASSIVGYTIGKTWKREVEQSREKELAEIQNGQCGGTIELDSGTLIYPGEGGPNPDELCIWTLHLRTLDGFRMNFTKLELSGGNADCVDSAVSIYGLTNLIPTDNLEKYRFCNENGNGGYHFLTGNIATVIFYTSSNFPVNSSSSGFSLHWEGSRFEPVATLHSSTYTSSPSGVIWYPVEGEYPGNAAMTWLVSGGGQNNASSLVVEILNVDFESCTFSDKCLCEALIIYHISQIGDLHEVDRFCGERKIAELVNISSDFIVAFYSDSNDIPGEGIGFQMNWRQQNITSSTPASEITTTELESTTITETPKTNVSSPRPIIRTCGGIIEGESGTIEYAMDEPYAIYERCLWTIRTWPPSREIELTKLTSGFENDFDYLVAFSFVAGQGLDETILLGRTTEEEQVVMKGSVVVLQFTSDSEVNGMGFRLHFRAVGGEEPLIHNAYDFNTGSPSGLIDFPPGSNTYYENYHLSTFVITPHYKWGWHNVVLNLEFYSLENSPGCNYDGLLIYSVQRNALQPLARICGTYTEPPSYTASAFVLLFYSDSTESGRGFNISWTEVPLLR